jgi:hypothetical protein
MKYLTIIAILLLIAAGVVYAQDGDDDDDIQIQPGGGAVATRTPVGFGTGTPTSTPHATPTSAPATVVATENATAEASPTSAPPTFTPGGPTLEPTPEPFRAVVDVSSAFIRANPAPDAPPVASSFRDDVLQVVGRNVDGTYFEVARPYRPDQSIGWVSIEVIDYKFLPEFLPLTDIETGVTGDQPLASPVEYAVFINEGVALRSLPNVQRGDRLLNIPPLVVVPVLGRYRDGEWLLVNYKGTEGWIIGFVIRGRDDILDLPKITGILPNDFAPQLQTEIISPEIQMARLEEARTYAEERTQLARDLEAFWWLVQQGEVMPCNPPPNVQEYLYGPRTIQELPELDRYLPRMNEGVGLLNDSIGVLDNCGVVDPFDVQEARNDAINAKIILENTLVQLDNLEEIIEMNS